MVLLKGHERSDHRRRNNNGWEKNEVIFFYFIFFQRFFSFFFLLKSQTPLDEEKPTHRKHNHSFVHISNSISRRTQRINERREEKRRKTQIQVADSSSTFLSAVSLAFPVPLLERTFHQIREKPRRIFFPIFSSSSSFWPSATASLLSGA